MVLHPVEIFKYACREIIKARDSPPFTPIVLQGKVPAYPCSSAVKRRKDHRSLSAAIFNWYKLTLTPCFRIPITVGGVSSPDTLHPKS